MSLLQAGEDAEAAEEVTAAAFRKWSAVNCSGLLARFEESCKLWMLLGVWDLVGGADSAQCSELGVWDSSLPDVHGCNNWPNIQKIYIYIYDKVSMQATEKLRPIKAPGVVRRGSRPCPAP